MNCERSEKEIKWEDDGISKIREELKDLDLPTEFASTKGKNIKGQINAEAVRTGMIRRYQRFQRKKLKEWQINKIRGSRLSRERKAFQIPK